MKEISVALYEPPMVFELGSFEEMTGATNLGTDTDVALPFTTEASASTIS